MIEILLAILLLPFWAVLFSAVALCFAIALVISAAIDCAKLAYRSWAGWYSQDMERQRHAVEEEVRRLNGRVFWDS